MLVTHSEKLTALYEQEPDVELMWSDLTRKLAQSGRKINRDYYHAKMIAHLRRKDAEYAALTPCPASWTLLVD
jgi:hypothetical protein